MYVSEIPGGGDEANAPQDDAQNAAGGQMGGVVGVEQLAHALPRAALAIVQPQQRNGQAGAQLNQRVNPVNKEEIIVTPCGLLRAFKKPELPAGRLYSVCAIRNSRRR